MGQIFPVYSKESIQSSYREKNSFSHPVTQAIASLANNNNHNLAIVELRVENIGPKFLDTKS